ncbi:MAG: ATP-dependent helicase, partial [Thermoleophilia bacterium]|nr:ATP-dependent helicase [Thermoleophilia bacterium]
MEPMIAATDHGPLEAARENSNGSTNEAARLATVEASLGSLNERQRQAASCGNGPLLIIAGAGTGKTTTLAHRVAYQITTGVDPGRILLLTFTRRAAGEMLRRVDSLLRARHSVGTSAAPRTGNSSVWGGTFHAIATRLLRLHGRSIGLDPGFTILDRTDAEDLMNFVRTELGLSRRERRFPQKATCFDIYSRCVDTGQRLELVLESAFPWCSDHADDLRALFGGYVDLKAEQSVLDYDDLLLFWRGLLRDPVAGGAVRARFDRVLVDEYQDTNALQAEIVSLLRPDSTGVTVVGDDAQSIYSFRAATVRNILDFPSQHADTTVVTLERNYRSTAPLLDVTNRVIAQAGERYEKDLWTERTQGEPAHLVLCEDEDTQTGFLVDTILEHREAGLLLRKQAVLFRASHHSLALELELGRRDIPFVKYGGLKFVEMAHVKDLLAFLRLAENPRDQIAAMRALLLVPGIGPARARELTAALTGTGAGTEGPFEAWADEHPPTAAAESW